MSEIEVIRRRGGNPDAVLAQIFEFRDAAKKKGLVFNSDSAWQALAQSLANDAQQANSGASNE